MDAPDTTAHTSLADGPEQGVAPPSGSSAPPFKLLVEGWRSLPHSYSIVNRQQCLELLRRPEVSLVFRDALAFAQLGQPVRGLLPPADERAMDELPGYEGEADAVYRISYPYDFGASMLPTTFVFATCERMVVRAEQCLNRHKSAAAQVRDNGVVVVTPSKWSRDGFIRSGIDPERVVIVPHGIDPAVFRPLPEAEREKVRAEKGYKDKFVFLHVSAMTGNKNVGEILRAFAAVVRKHPHARLLLKGLDGIFQSNFWIAQELGRLSPAERALVQPNIAYCGQSLNVREQAMLYQIADAYVAPYQSEGFCIPALEAAACGLPLIVTEGGATDDFTTPDFALPVKAELGDHAHDGSLWLRIDPASLRNQMLRVVQDEPFREQAPLAGPAHTHAHYSWKTVVDRMLRVVQNVTVS